MTLLGVSLCPVPPFGQRERLAPRLERALEEIRSSDGQDASVEAKNKSLIKFGRNDDPGTVEETVWNTGGLEAYPTGNDIDVVVVSTDAGDTQTVVVEGHTLTNGVLVFTVQRVTLTGTTPAALGTPSYRATCLYSVPHYPSEF